MSSEEIGFGDSSVEEIGGRKALETFEQLATQAMEREECWTS